MRWPWLSVSLRSCMWAHFLDGFPHYACTLFSAHSAAFFFFCWVTHLFVLMTMSLCCHGQKWIQKRYCYDDHAMVVLMTSESSESWEMTDSHCYCVRLDIRWHGANQLILWKSLSWNNSSNELDRNRFCPHNILAFNSQGELIAHDSCQM